MHKLFPDCHNISSYNQLSMQVEASPEKKSVPESKAR